MQSENYKLAEQVIEKNRQLVLDCASLDGTWTLDSDQEGIQCHIKKDSTSGVNIGRSTTRISRPISVVSNDISEISNIKLHDSKVIDAKTIEKFSDDFVIGYFSAQGFKEGVNRDICFAQRRFQEGDRTIYVRGSLEHPSVPVSSDLSRGTIIFGGYVLTRVDDNNTDVIFISCVRPGGNAPEHVVNSLAGKSRDKLKVVKDFLEK